MFIAVRKRDICHISHIEGFIAETNLNHDPESFYIFRSVQSLVLHSTEVRKRGHKNLIASLYCDAANRWLSTLQQQKKYSTAFQNCSEFWDMGHGKLCSVDKEISHAIFCCRTERVERHVFLQLFWNDSGRMSKGRLFQEVNDTNGSKLCSSLPIFGKDSWKKSIAWLLAWYTLRVEMSEQ